MWSDAVMCSQSSWYTTSVHKWPAASVGWLTAGKDSTCDINASGLSIRYNQSSCMHLTIHMHTCTSSKFVLLKVTDSTLISPHPELDMATPDRRSTNQNTTQINNLQCGGEGYGTIVLCICTFAHATTGYHWVACNMHWLWMSQVMSTEEAHWMYITAPWVINGRGLTLTASSCCLPE